MRSFLLHDAEAVHVENLRKLDEHLRKVFMGAVARGAQQAEAENQLTPAPTVALAVSNERGKRRAKARGNLHAVK